MIRVLIFLRATASSNADPMYGMGTTEGSVADEISLHPAKDGLTTPCVFGFPIIAACRQDDGSRNARQGPSCMSRTRFLGQPFLLAWNGMSIGEGGLYGVSRWQVTHGFVRRDSGVDLVGV